MLTFKIKLVYSVIKSLKRNISKQIPFIIKKTRKVSERTMFYLSQAKYNISKQKKVYNKIKTNIFKP